MDLRRRNVEMAAEGSCTNMRWRCLSLGPTDSLRCSSARKRWSYLKQMSTLQIQFTKTIIAPTDAVISNYGYQSIGSLCVFRRVRMFVRVRLAVLTIGVCHSQERRCCWTLGNEVPSYHERLIIIELTQFSNSDDTKMTLRFFSVLLS